MKFFAFILICASAFGQAFGTFGLNNPATVMALQEELQPGQISGLLIWVMGNTNVYVDNGTTPCSDGNSVQLWKDQSGNGNDLKQLTGPNQPKFRAAAINGLPAVDIGVSATASITNRTAINITIPLTIFMVIYPTNGTSVGYALRTGNPVVEFATGTGLLRLGTTGGSMESPIQGKQWHQVTMSLGTANENTILFPRSRGYVFGKKIGEVNGNNTVYDFTRIGDYVTTPMDGMVAEFAVFNRRLRDFEMRGVELYLKKKYNLPHSF